jgi:anti-sigma B factor antagonist
MALEVNKKELANHICVLEVAGRITAASTTELKDQIKSLILAGYIYLIFDLSKTTFIDSSGLSAFVSGLKQVREKGGILNLTSLQPDVRSIFSLTMLDRVFEMYSTVSDAVQSVRNN